MIEAPAHPPDDEPTPAAQAAEHLRTLSTFHYLLGVLTFLVAGLFIVYLVVGMVSMAELTADERSRLPEGFGAHFSRMGYLGLAIGGVLALMNVISGYCLSLRKLRGVSLFTAVLNLVWAPAGTCLGVITLVILLREPARMLYVTPPTYPPS